MKGFAKSVVADCLKVHIVVITTIAKVRTQDYREIGHIMPSQDGGYSGVRCGQLVAHADEPRAVVEALVRAYNAERAEMASDSGAA